MPGEDPRTVYQANDFDFRLREGAVAIDAGTLIPGINSNYTGSAPDLGAYESSQPAPHYGPRQ